MKIGMGVPAATHPFTRLVRKPRKNWRRSSRKVGQSLWILGNKLPRNLVGDSLHHMRRSGVNGRMKVLERGKLYRVSDVGKSFQELAKINPDSNYLEFCIADFF